VIESFADPEAEKIFNGIVSRKLPLLIQQTARRRLVYFDDSDVLRTCSLHPVTDLRRFIETARVNTASVSTTNIESASGGKRAKRQM